MRQLLCVLAAGLISAAPAYADDDDDNPFKDYYKQLRKQQKRQAEFHREQQKRQQEFLREQHKRQQELYREQQWQPYGYGYPQSNNYYPPQTFGAPPFVPFGLQPGGYVPNPVIPGYGYGFPSYRPSYQGYFPPMTVRPWRDDDDDDDDDD